MKWKKVLLLLIPVLLVCGYYCVSEQKVRKENSSMTGINIKNNQNMDQAQEVIWSNSRYYFYDENEKGIVEYSETGIKQKIIETEENVLICGNEENLFFINENKLYQYNLKDKTLIYEDVQSLNTEKMQICVKGHYLYLFGEGFICIYSAQNINKRENSLGKSIEKSIEGIDYENLFYEGEEEILFVFQRYKYDSEKENLRIKETDSYTMIYTIDGNLDISGMLIEKVTGIKVSGSYDMVTADKKGVIRIGEAVEFYQDKEKEELVNKDVTYGEYGADYAMNSAVISDTVLIIHASSYESSDLTLNNGSLNQHQSDNLWYVDLKSKDTWKNYCFGRGELVWYADSKCYILFKEGELITYDVKTQKEICRNSAEWFDKDSDYQYEVTLCHDNWFIFNENSLVDVVPMNGYLE